jgi:hypothetical protein
VSESNGEGSAVIKMINSKEQWESCECGLLLTETDAETLSDQSVDSSKVMNAVSKNAKAALPLGEEQPEKPKGRSEYSGKQINLIIIIIN